MKQLSLCITVLIYPWLSYFLALGGRQESTFVCADVDCFKDSDQSLSFLTSPQSRQIQALIKMDSPREKKKEKVYNIVEGKISTEAKPVEYVVTVPVFTDGMAPVYQPGQKMEFLADFYFLDSRFSLQIYPNGCSPHNNGFVSISLKNENKYDVFVNCEIKMGRSNRFNFKVQNERIPAKGFIGDWRCEIIEFFNDRSFYRRDPEVTCRITKLWKQLRTDDDDEGCIQNTVKSEYKLLKETRRGIDDLNEEVKSGIDDLWHAQNKVSRKLSKLDEDVDDRLASIESTQKQIREDLIRISSDNLKTILRGPFKDIFLSMIMESQKKEDILLNKINEMEAKFENRMNELTDKMNKLETCIRLNQCCKDEQFLAEKIPEDKIVDLESDDDTADPEGFSSNNWLTAKVQTLGSI